MRDNSIWSKGPFHVEHIPQRKDSWFSVRDEQDNGVKSFDTEEEAQKYCDQLNKRRGFKIVEPKS